MTKPAHTPGPWGTKGGALKDSNFGNRNCRVTAMEDSRGWSTVAKVYGGPQDSSPEAEANARLIAAAPDMAMALQTIALHCPSLDADGIRAHCDAALKKAGVQ